VGLTEFSKHALVWEPTRDECRDSVELVERFAARAASERGHRWAHGSDELYLVADLPLPGAQAYGNFEQVENGVGSVRFLEQRITESAGQLASLNHKRIAVVTGTAMGRLMPLITPHLERHTGGAFELVVVENDLFGPRVTTAGLLPGAVFKRVLQERGDLDMALLPAEAVNDDQRFIDDMALTDLIDAVPVDVRCSYDFADALVEGGV
jgi:NifB/MoaA-like Fe-S oxidoreductase